MHISRDDAEIRLNTGDVLNYSGGYKGSGDREGAWRGGRDRDDM